MYWFGLFLGFFFDFFDDSRDDFFYDYLTIFFEGYFFDNVFDKSQPFPDVLPDTPELLMIKTSSFSGLQRMPHADKYVDYDDTHIGAKTLFKWDYL